jgi:hypothetical protein
MDFEILPYNAVHGQVVKVYYFKPLAHQHCGIESQQGLWILSCEKASLWYIRGSTQVPEKINKTVLEVIIYQGFVFLSSRDNSRESSRSALSCRKQ